MTQLTIRDAQCEDAQQILDFITELAIYEKAEDQVLATIDTIKSSIFSAHSHVDAIICEYQGEAIGMAIYFYNYSTWLAKPGLFLEDLYVTQAHRGKGAGKQLLKHLANIALDKGCGRFEWNCLDWNTPSRAFYESIGAQSQDEWVGYRMSGQTLEDFAK